MRWGVYSYSEKKNTITYTLELHIAYGCWNIDNNLFGVSILGFRTGFLARVVRNNLFEVSIHGFRTEMLTRVIENNLFQVAMHGFRTKILTRIVARNQNQDSYE